MSGLSSNESFIKSQESMVQGAIRTPKPINLLKTEFDNIIDKYNATENAKINKSNVYYIYYTLYYLLYTVLVLLYCYYYFLFFFLFRIMKII